MQKTISFLLWTLLLASSALSQNSPVNLLREAEAGNVSAELKLAKALQFGTGTPRDMQQAVRWYHKAAHDGSPEAAFILGTLAYNGDVLGDGISASIDQAWAWFEVAKILKYPEAPEAILRLEPEMTQMTIQKGHELAAYMLLEGVVIPRNHAAALSEIDWLQQHGTSTAKLLLGEIYRTGDGVPKDLPKARELCKEAFQMRAVGAATCLAQVSQEQGNERDAFDWFKKDAQTGLVSAIFETAQRLKDGRGTKSNPVEALAWIIRADAGRAAGAAELRVKFAAGLSEKQIAEAQKKSAALNINSLSLPRLGTLSRN